MRGKKYAKRRTEKRTPHHDIFVVRYCRNAHTYRNTYTVYDTDRKHTSRFGRVIGFACCHSSEGLSFFLYPCRYCNAPRRRFPLNIMRQRTHGFGYVVGRKRLIFPFLSIVTRQIFLSPPPSLSL